MNDRDNPTDIHRDEQHDARADSHPVRDAGRVIRLLLAAAIVVAVIIVAFDNKGDVRVGYVFGDASQPGWIVLIAAAVAGIVVGWLIKHRPRHRH